MRRFDRWRQIIALHDKVWRHRRWSLERRKRICDWLHKLSIEEASK